MGIGAILKGWWEDCQESGRESMDRAIESCWYCKHDVGRFERTRCNLRKIAFQGIFRDYDEGSALATKGYKCSEWELDRKRLKRSGNYQCSNKYWDVFRDGVKGT